MRVAFIITGSTIAPTFHLAESKNHVKHKRTSGLARKSWWHSQGIFPSVPERMRVPIQLWLTKATAQYITWLVQNL